MSTIILPMSIPERDYTLCNDTATFTLKSYNERVVPLFEHLEIFGDILALEDTHELIPEIHERQKLGSVLSINGYQATVELDPVLEPFHQVVYFDNGNWFIGIKCNCKKSRKRHTYEILAFEYFTLCYGRMTRKGFKH